MAEMDALLVLRTRWEGLLVGGRGWRTSAAHRRKAIELIGEANAAGAGLVSACRAIGICLRTLKRANQKKCGSTSRQRTQNRSWRYHSFGSPEW